MLLLAHTADAAKKSKKKAHINLPSASASTDSQFSVLEEINFYGDKPIGLSNTTLEWSLPQDWDIGIGAYGVPIDKQINAYDISVLINAEKTFNLAQNLAVAAGVSLGSDIVSAGTKSGIDIFSYVNASTKLLNIALGAGGYYANTWLGGYSMVGVSAFAAVPISQSFSLQYGFLSGKNNLSGSTLELYYRISPAMDIGFGVQTQYNNREQVLSGVVSFYYH